MDPKKVAIVRPISKTFVYQKVSAGREQSKHSSHKNLLLYCWSSWSSWRDSVGCLGGVFGEVMVVIEMVAKAKDGGEVREVFFVLSAEIIQVSYSAWVRCPCGNVCNLEEESKPPSTVFRYQSSRSSKSQKNQFFNNNKINQKILLLLFLTMFALFLMIPCFITSVDFDSKFRLSDLRIFFFFLWHPIYEYSQLIRWRSLLVEEVVVLEEISVDWSVRAKNL